MNLVGQQSSSGGMCIRPPVRINQSLEEERLIGRIKRYTDLPDGGGYGFIDCEDTKLRFTRDVYIHKNQMIGLGLQVGDEVSFMVIRNAKGDPQARNVMRAEDALIMRTTGSVSLGIGGLGDGGSCGPGIGGMGSVTGVMGGMGCMGGMGMMDHIHSHAGHLSGIGCGMMDEVQARQFQASLRG